MIQEIRVKNFLSFRDETVLSFEATKDTTFEDYQVVEVAPKVRLLRFALIYGANASGKTNIIRIIEFLQGFWFTSQGSIDSKTGVIPFLLDRNTPNEPSRFELRFYIKDIAYRYILVLNESYVINEELYCYRSIRPTMLFKRSYSNGQSVVEFNTNIVKISPAAQEELTLKCLPNTSFFMARNQVNIALDLIDDARNWMREQIPQVITPRTYMYDYAKECMAENKDLKKYLLQFVHRADFNITDIHSNKVHKKVPEKLISEILNMEPTLPNEKKEILKKTGTLPQIKTHFEHTVKNDRGIETYVLPDFLQSVGTQRTFGLEAAIYYALQKSAFLAIDEIEASLHPDLIEFILEMFLKEKSRSQLLITSHYDPLLNTVGDLIRKDGVWFTEKGEAGDTKLYSLTDFKGLNKISSFQRAYRNGVFGGLPNIKG